MPHGSLAAARSSFLQSTTHDQLSPTVDDFDFPVARSRQSAVQILAHHLARPFRAQRFTSLYRAYLSTLAAKPRKNTVLPGSPSAHKRVHFQKSGRLANSGSNEGRILHKRSLVERFFVCSFGPSGMYTCMWLYVYINTYKYIYIYIYIYIHIMFMFLRMCTSIILVCLARFTAPSLVEGPKLTESEDSEPKMLKRRCRIYRIFHGCPESPELAILHFGGGNYVICRN